jgi:hypothetical protein
MRERGGTGTKERERGVGKITSERKVERQNIGNRKINDEHERRYRDRDCMI